MKLISKLDRLWKKVAAVLTATGLITGAVLGVSQLFESLFGDPEKATAKVDELEVRYAATLREFLQIEDLEQGDLTTDELRRAGVVISVQTTLSGFAGDDVTVVPVLHRATDQRPLLDRLARPVVVEPDASEVTRDLAVWIEAPSDPGTYSTVVEVRYGSEKLTEKRSQNFDWPLPTSGSLTYPVPTRVLAGPLDNEYTSRGNRPPAPLEETGYWSKISFRYLGDPKCEKGGTLYPCYLPLRTAPDFRDDVGRVVTRGWPAHERDWVWVTCQAYGNGIPNEGQLQNSAGQASNLWNLVGLGSDGSGQKFAWGNDLWFTEQGPVEPDGTPRFLC